MVMHNEGMCKNNPAPPPMTIAPTTTVKPSSVPMMVAMSMDSVPLRDLFQLLAKQGRQTGFGGYQFGKNLGLGPFLHEV